jgi:hypothetical protein
MNRMPTFVKNVFISLLVALLAGCGTGEAVTSPAASLTTAPPAATATFTPVLSPTPTAELAIADDTETSSSQEGNLNDVPVPTAASDLVPAYTLADRQHDFAHDVLGLLTATSARGQDDLEQLALMARLALDIDPALLDNLPVETLTALSSVVERAAGLDEASVRQAATSLGLTDSATESAPAWLTVDYSAITLNPAQQIVQIPFSEQIRLNDNASFSLSGRRVNPQTMEIEPLERVNLPAESVSVDADQPNVLVIQTTEPIHKWTQFMLNPGAVTALGETANAAKTPVEQQVPIPTGKTIFDALMDLAPFIPTEEGKMFFTPQAYGGPEPITLPERIGPELEAYMRDRLTRILELSLKHGYITPEWQAELLAHYDGQIELTGTPGESRTEGTYTLVDVIPDPTLRAAALIAMAYPVGGDLVKAVLTGENGSGRPIRAIIFEDDPRLPDIFAGENYYPLLGRAWARQDILRNGDHSIVIVFDPALKNGKEPVELLAPTMFHEIVIHEVDGGSFDEELVANMAEALLYFHLVSLDPNIFKSGTSMTQVQNLEAFALINTLKKREGITGFGLLPNRAKPDLNVFPNNLANRTFDSYESFIYIFYEDALNDKNLQYDAQSTGSQILVRYLKALLGDDIELPASLNTFSTSADDKYPDYSRPLIQFLDENLGRGPLTNEKIVTLARELKWQVVNASPDKPK